MDSPLWLSHSLTASVTSKDSHSPSVCVRTTLLSMYRCVGDVRSLWPKICRKDRAMTGQSSETEIISLIYLFKNIYCANNCTKMLENVLWGLVVVSLDKEKYPELYVPQSCSTSPPTLTTKWVIYNWLPQWLIQVFCDRQDVNISLSKVKCLEHQTKHSRFEIVPH